TLTPPYSLHTAVPQAGQRNTVCGRPLSVGIGNGAGSPDSSSTRSDSIRALSTNALPVWRWQSRQWQQCTNIGAERMRYLTAPQEQEPERVEVITRPACYLSLAKETLHGPGTQS